MKRKLLATVALTSAVCMFEATSSPATVHYVNVNSKKPKPPYTNWVTAATTIQNAVNVAAANDVVLVTNGAYAGGITVTNPLALLSVKGPQFTKIDGGGTVRCISLADGASLTGFTLTNGYSNGYSGDGAGVWCTSTYAFLTNCVITGNHALGAWRGNNINPSLVFIGGNGGGAAGGKLFNCLLTGNSANSGGGAANCTLYNCTLTGNVCLNSSAPNQWWYVYYGRGGGAYASVLDNCIVCSNTATSGANYTNSVLNYCCTAPMPTNGVGNITNDPAFVNAAAGDFHLQANSPCINAGNNAYATTATDLDGHPRIVSGTVDLGAYEFQGTGSVISYAWLQQNGLTTGGSADYTDPDHDGMNNWQEWICDTCPTNAASCLRLTIISNTPPVAVTFSSSAARLYTLLCSTNLTPSSVWTPVPGQSDIPGSGDVLALTDANPPAPAFYRVSVRFP